MVCDHAYSLEKSPRVRLGYDCALRRLIFHRCWVCWDRLPCHALAAFAPDVREPDSGCSLADFALVIHRTGLG